MFRNAVLMLTSCLACLAASEAVMRFVFEPIDFLKVSLQEDPVLNYKIPGKESGHDAFGFRNKTIPDTVDVLAIGDSMTYGNMALSTESWPAQYGQITGQTVYNAGIGGYGPAHYLHNLKTLTPELMPRAVIFGLYTGNDFLDTYNLVYGNENWSSYRNPDNQDQVDAEPLIIPRPGRFMGQTRDWLAHNSVLYRVATQSAVFDQVRLQERQQAIPLTYTIEYKDTPYLLSQKAMAYTDYNDPRIQEGFEISKRLIMEAKAYCDANSMDFHVSIMPVKEQVFIEALPELFSEEQHVELADFMTSLSTLHTELGAFLTDNNIDFVDLTPAFKDALTQKDIYPSADGHPNGVGYAVAAKTMIDAFARPKS